MPDEDEFRFVIRAYTPETIPMVRLAAYMSDLAVLLGETAAVHFVRIDPSSVAIVHRADHEAVPKINHRVQRTRIGDGPTDAMHAFRRLNSKLKEDNGSADLERGGAVVLQFPGGEELADEEAVFRVEKEGTLDGVPIRLGGRGDPVPVHLQSGEDVLTSCRANRAVAQRIGQHIFVTELRVYGTGRWLRSGAGDWLLERFNIADFEPLDTTPLPELVTRMRAFPGNEWNDIANPWSELKRLRHGDGDGQ
jgi:hypothetical protein